MSTISISTILLPKKELDYSKWSVIACDQFTSEPKYWEQLRTFVADEPSALNIIYPEVYLGASDKAERSEKIRQTMDKYIKDNILYGVDDFILVDRQTNDGMHRIGLMLAVDLEDYEYTANNSALIKATEKTVVERLPARIAIRQNAGLELPHIMLLMDDTNNKILGDLMAKKNSLDKLYDFDLNMNGGHLTGYRVEDSESVKAQIMKLISPEVATKKYGKSAPILFAVGDGNHSLATAKECWNNLKGTLTASMQQNHPARFALCELVNLHDKSLVFQPIHRVVFGADIQLVKYLQSNLKGEAQTKAVFDGKEYVININISPEDAIADIQNLLDEYSKSREGVTLDYIHGEESLLAVAKANNAVALFMPTISKNSLFDYVARRGALPRKSFSMGHAEDKRYYFEAKSIK